MRAYRTRQRDETEALRRADGRGELFDQLHQTTAERDQLAADNETLRARVRRLEAELRQQRATPPPSPPPPPARPAIPASPSVSDGPRLSRAERRRLEREQRRRGPA